MTITPELSAALATIFTCFLNGLFLYLFRRLIFQRKASIDERDSMAEQRTSITGGYSDLIRSLKDQLEDQRKQTAALALVVDQNRTSYLSEAKKQREECAEEIKQIKGNAARENALLSNSIKRMREEYESEFQEMRESFSAELAKRDEHNAKCEAKYAEVLLQLRSLQFNAQIKSDGVPGSPPS